MGKIKKLILTIDIDNDFTNVPLEGTQELKWDGLTRGLPLILSRLDRVALSHKKTLCVTVFCRADWQVEREMGDITWVFKKTSSVLSSSSYENLTIDIQWHPHLYELKENEWTLPTSKGLAAEQLEDTYKKIQAAGFKVECSRIGECFFNKEILNSLISLGIRIDSTAFPKRDLGHTNWEDAPFETYNHPLECFASEERGPLVEAPFAMIPIKAPYEDVKRLRYLNLVYSTKFTELPIKELYLEHIVTIIHPYEVLTLDDPNKHQLFGSMESITRNLELILEKPGIRSILLKEINNEK